MFLFFEKAVLAGIYMLKVNNRNTRTKYFTPCSSASIVNFEHVIATGKECKKLISISPKIIRKTKAREYFRKRQNQYLF